MLNKALKWSKQFVLCWFLSGHPRVQVNICAKLKEIPSWHSWDRKGWMDINTGAPHVTKAKQLQKWKVALRRVDLEEEWHYDTILQFMANVIKMMLLKSSTGSVLTVWSWMFPFIRIIFRPSAVVCSIFPGLSENRTDHHSIQSLFLFGFFTQKDTNERKAPSPDSLGHDCLSAFAFPHIISELTVLVCGSLVSLALNCSWPYDRPGSGSMLDSSNVVLNTN